MVCAISWPHPSSATIVKAYLAARNSRDSATFQKWVDTYGEPGLSRLEEHEFNMTKLYGQHTFKKVVFDAPYEMVAEVRDGKNNSTHLTFWFDSKGKVSYILMLRDLYP